MPSKSALSPLDDIRQNIERARAVIAQSSVEAFAHDWIKVYAVTRCLEIISEASRRLPDSIKKRHPDIDWPRIASAGNIYRHEYPDVDPIMLWDTVVRALPALHEVVALEMKDLDQRQ